MRDGAGAGAGASRSVVKAQDGNGDAVKNARRSTIYDIMQAFVNHPHTTGFVFVRCHDSVFLVDHV